MKAIIFFILLLSAQVAAQQILSYDFELRIDPGAKSISVQGSMEADFNQSDTLNLLLWKNSSVTEINCNGVRAEYQFDTLTSSPLMYIPNGKKLVIIKSPGSNSKQSIKINYTSDMSGLEGWANSFSEDWIELNFYCAWFPVCLTGGNFTSKFKVYVDDEFDISGSGIITKKEDYWEIAQPWNSFDNVIIASNELKSRAYNSGEKLIEIYYNEDKFSRNEANLALNECRNVLKFFQGCFDKRDSTYLKFVIAPFEEGGYSRRNFVRMGSLEYDLNTAKGIAHEIAHFWWYGASTTTWEDWLNEAFAEYSMLLYIREKYGVEEFNKQIEEYKTRAKYHDKGLPPVWGINRNSPEAYSVLYVKGSLILCELEELTGKETFYNFLKNLSCSKIKTTSELLDYVGKEMSAETKHWLENKLKNG